MKQYFWIIFIAAAALAACTQKSPLPVYSNESSAYRIDFMETAHSENADTIYHRFNVIDKQSNRKELIGDIKTTEIETVTSDRGITVEGIRRMPLSLGVIPENMVVSLLIDRNVHAEDMENIKNATRYIVENLSANPVYISFFDSQLGETQRIAADNFELFDSEFKVAANNDKIIFDVAYLKFLELCGLGKPTPDTEFAALINNKNFKKVLVILTDGRVDANNQRTADFIQQFSDAVQQLDDDKENRQQIEIHAIRYGDEAADVDFTLSYLCVDIRNENVRGGAYFADPVAFIDNLKVSDGSVPDYELVMLNPKGKIYQGKPFYTGLQIAKSGATLSGEVRYIVGTLLTPIKTGSSGALLQILYGLAGGLLLLGAGFLVMQPVIPYVRFKFENFNRKYVRSYSFDNDTVLQCHYCLNEIRDGEEIVTKCEHTVHKHCWIENGCKCTDYGKNCKHGKQFLYDSNRLFNANNRPYYTRWAMYGMAGGLLSWLLFQLIMYFFPTPFSSLIHWLLSLFDGDTAGASAFYPKLGALFVAGLLSGFIIVLIFSLLNRYRQRKKDSIPIVLLRSLAGAAAVFIAFLLCALIFIPANADATNIATDWIPWVLAGCAGGAVLFFRTNTVILQILPGMALSGIICFLILLTGSVFGIYAVVFGLMIFGGAAGIAFISARKIIHTYFLKFRGEKDEKIAIHKWMSVAGGSNEVSIGNSPDATIRMTWDQHPSIRDFHVKLFFDRKNRLPCIKILSSDVTYNGIFAKNKDEFLLKNGVKFTIGNTTFQYIENA